MEPLRTERWYTESDRFLNVGGIDDRELRRLAAVTAMNAPPEALTSASVVIAHLYRLAGDTDECALGLQPRIVL